MRIAVVTSTFPPYAGGIGNVAAFLARCLVNRGHDVTIFTPQYGHIPEEIKDLPIKRLKPLFSIGNAAFVPGLAKQLKGFDIIHIHYPFFGGAEVIFLAQKKLARAGAKIVLHYHMDVIGNGVRRLFFKLHNAVLLPWMIFRADRVVVTSFDYATHSNIAPLLKGRPEHFVEIPNGVDSTFFSPGPPSAELLQKHGLADDEKIILFVGGLDRAHYFKGVEYLLEALSRMRTEVYDAKLIIVGEGDLKARYQDLAVQLNIAHRVIFMGYVPNDLLPEYYRLADVAVLPSVDRSEAFGLTLLEAMACAKPVVASNLSGVRSVVEENVNGLLSEIRNADDLATKLHYIITHKDVAHQFGIAGREKVEKRYEWENLALELESLYQELKGGAS